MRIRLKFQSKNSVLVGFDYQYAIAVFIYRQLSKIDKNFADDLHQKKGGKGFTFTDIKPLSPFKIDKNGLFINSFAIDISTADENIYSFLLKSFELKSTKIFFSKESDFFLIDVAQLPDIIFQPTMRLVSRSPIAVKVLLEGHRHGQYIDPTHPLWAGKCAEIIGKRVGVYVDANTKFAVDVHDFKKDGRKISSRNSDVTKIIAYKVDFTLTADLKLLENCVLGGMGLNTSMGFGYLENIND